MTRWLWPRHGVGTLLALLLASHSAQASDPGAKLYARRCATCHETSFVGHARPDVRAHKSAAYVYSVLTHGKMRRLAQGLTEAERVAVAEHFSGKAYLPGQPRDAQAISPACDAAHAALDASDPPAFASWGSDLGNSRFVPAARAGLRAEQVPGLELLWAVALPETSLVRSQPAVGGGAVFVGSQNGGVYALDEATGCTRWRYDALGEIRTAVSLSAWEPGAAADAPPFVYFGDDGANVYALDAASGRLLWRTALGEDPATTLTGALTLHEGRLYVPLSSVEDMFAIDPGYECCTHRGAVVALDARSGRVLWKTPTIAEPARVVGAKPNGGSVRGPAGASVWNPPTIDARRKLLYVGTGNNKTRATTAQSDSVLALDLETGRVAWAFQAVAGDAWNGGCGPSLAQGNCPESPGPDSDFGAPPVLVTAGGRELLFAGAKSGVVYALDPDAGGSLVWKTRVGRGGTSGGVHFGMAAGDGALYVPIYDAGDGRVDGWAARPGLYALEAATGRLRWARGQAELCAGDTDCFAGISAPVTAIPGAVFAASIDGTTRAFDARDGRVLWSFDAVRRFPSLAGGTAQGGGLASAGGPVVANGRLFLGAGHAWTKRGGDALLVFAPAHAGAAPQLSGGGLELGR